MDEALKIYPQPSDGEDIRPQLSVSGIIISVDLNRGKGGGGDTIVNACPHCSVQYELYFFSALGNRF